jgi:hypothetical protein
MRDSLRVLRGYKDYELSDSNSRPLSWRLCVSPIHPTQSPMNSCIIRVSSVFHLWLNSPIVFPSLPPSFSTQMALNRGVFQSIPRSRVEVIAVGVSGALEGNAVKDSSGRKLRNLRG